tara:strand:- start:6311 stop:7402 length:1092 start_codon:yes stop_codon:yes gene_type:complete
MSTIEPTADPAATGDTRQSAVVFDNVSIVFGDKPQLALPLMDAGQSRSDIQSETGQVLGVHNCSLTVAEGEILVLMGLSGSGKSTLLRAVNSLNPVVRGHVLVNDRGTMIDVTNADAKTLRRVRLSCVAMVFQQFGLLPWRNVIDNVGLGLEFAGMSREEREEKCRHQLELVGLSDWEDRLVGELSGGMQQRVGLSRAFATEAPILLMDEPFSALDPLIRNRLQDELLELQHNLKRTIIFVSHDLDEAFKLGDRIAIMEGGRIVQCGTPPEIIRNPANEYVADFVAHMNPLGVLRASDVMVDGEAPAGSDDIHADTKLQDVMEPLNEGRVLNVTSEEGEHLGVIRPKEIVSALTPRERPETTE